MAPQQQPVAVGQHQQPSHADHANRQAARPRKRKGKQSEPTPEAHAVQPKQQQQQVQPTPREPTSAPAAPSEPIAPGGDKINAKRPSQEPVVPSERASVKKQQVPSLVKEASLAKNRIETAVPVVTVAPTIAKQLSTDDADDGIELDGSSNSGSSVKDISEDHNKSASVSPVMAQASTISDKTSASLTKHAAEEAPIEQMAGSMCTPVKPATKVGTLTKQQLAANQQVIDADEQQLQQKLQTKQRKSSLQDTSLSIGSLCKVCEQHVYQMERMQAEKSVYHKKCFRCHQCKIQLRVDNYSSHEGQVYCKAHHRQIFQPQAKLDNEDDVDIVTKSTKPVDDYLLHRGRLSDLKFSFLQPKQEEIRKRQMIICENEPAELPKDVIRSDTKMDDGLDQINLKLNNILEKFERGTASSDDDRQPSSAGVVIDKPSFNIRQTLMAFESRMSNPSGDDANESKINSERPVVRKLNNLNGFLNSQNSQDSGEVASLPTKPLAVRRSESLMLRLKKYESRIAGERVDDDEENSDDGEINNNNGDSWKSSKLPKGLGESDSKRVPKKLTSIDLSSLKNQWENGDIKNKRSDDDESQDDAAATKPGDNISNGNSPSAQKYEELSRIRQQLARRKSGESGSIRNIYENAIKEAQLQQQASRRESSDLSALHGLSTSDIQQQLLQNGSTSSQNNKTPATPNKDHFQLNLSNKANKLKERFELGLINNSSRDDSDLSDADEGPVLSRLDQIRQEKLEDLSVFTDGEIKAREARSLFKQIDRRLSASNGSDRRPAISTRSLATIGASMRTKLTNQMNNQENATQSSPTAATTTTNHFNDHVNSNNSTNSINNSDTNNYHHQLEKEQPIRLTNNVRT